jgi:DNA-binding transcriptional MocR family regulator
MSSFVSSTNTAIASKMLRIGYITGEVCLICRIIKNKRKNDVHMTGFVEDILEGCNTHYNNALKMCQKQRQTYTTQDLKEMDDILSKVEKFEAECNHHVKTIHKNGHLLFA